MYSFAFCSFFIGEIWYFCPFLASLKVDEWTPSWKPEVWVSVSLPPPPTKWSHPVHGLFEPSSLSGTWSCKSLMKVSSCTEYPPWSPLTPPVFPCPHLSSFLLILATSKPSGPLSSASLVLCLIYGGEAGDVVWEHILVKRSRDSDHKEMDEQDDVTQWKARVELALLKSLG